MKRGDVTMGCNCDRFVSFKTVFADIVMLLLRLVGTTGGKRGIVEEVLLAGLVWLAALPFGAFMVRSRWQTLLDSASSQSQCSISSVLSGNKPLYFLVSTWAVPVETFIALIPIVYLVEAFAVGRTDFVSIDDCILGAVLDTTAVRSTIGGGGTVCECGLGATAVCDCSIGATAFDTAL